MLQKTLQSASANNSQRLKPSQAFVENRQQRRSSSFKRCRVSSPPPLVLCRTKSMPARLAQSNEYLGGPLLWLRGGEKVPYQSLPKDGPRRESEERRPPRPLLRFLGAPIRKIQTRCPVSSSSSSSSSVAPIAQEQQIIVYVKPEERNDTFETDVMSEYDEDDSTLIEYSDDEDEGFDCHDAIDDDMLHGLSFLEEEEEERE